MKLIKYIYKNYLHVVAAILASLVFSFLVFPALLKFQFLKSFLNETSFKYFIGTTALVLLIIIRSWDGANNLWKKYKNTYTLERPPFLYLDYLFLFLATSFLLVFIFQRESIPNPSYEFKIFVGVTFILLILWLVSSYYWRRKEKGEKVDKYDKYFLSDEPIQSIKQDLLGREKFIEDLYREIIKLPFSDSFVFGLYGSWGEGKTSVINLLRNKFNENDCFLAVNFDPWYFKDEEAILTAFYKQVEQALDQRYIFPNLKKTFSRYRKLISFGLSQAGVSIDFSLNEETLEDVKQKIESYIADTKKKVLIIIDDIDRLQPKDILHIFKVIRLNAKFKNTIFLLSFDPIVIQNYLNKAFNADLEFLEKIVQKPVPLPAIEQRDIDNFLDVHIDRLFKELKIQKNVREKFEKEFVYLYQTQIRKLFKTLRHAKRYLNGLRSTLPSVKNEVNLCDFLILEVIRIFFPRVYYDIWQNPWFYIPLNWSDTTYFLSPFKFTNREDEKYPQIKKHIDDVLKEEKEAGVLKELLMSIFFVEVKNALGRSRTDHLNVARSYRADKRITHPVSFRKYFMLKVVLTELSDEFIETTLDLWNTAKSKERESVMKKTIFEIQKKNKLLEFFKQLIVFIDKIQGNIAPSLIRTIYKNASKFSKKGTENLWNSEYDEAHILLLWLVNDKVEKNKVQNILEEVISSTPSIPFAVHVILSCKKERGGSFHNIYDSIQIEKLQDKVSKRLEKYFIKGEKDIFEDLRDERDWVFVLYQWATNWMTFKGKKNKTVSTYIFSIIEKDAKKFIKFLAHQRQKSASDTWTFNLDELGKIYDLKKLRKSAEKFKGSELLTKNEREICTQFSALVDNNFKK